MLGAVGAAVVITLITIMAVYVSSKWKLTGPGVCMRLTVCARASSWRGVCKETSRVFNRSNLDLDEACV